MSKLIILFTMMALIFGSGAAIYLHQGSIMVSIVLMIPAWLFGKEALWLYREKA